MGPTAPARLEDLRGRGVSGVARDAAIRLPTTELQNSVWAMATHIMGGIAADHAQHFWDVDLGHGVLVYVDKSRTPDLEKVLIQLEAMFADVQFKAVRLSEPIVRAIMDNRETVKKGSIEDLALEVHKIREAGGFVQGLRSGVRLLGKVPEKTLLIANADKVYVFEGDEMDICRQISELPRKKTAPTPKKVLSKMVALRLFRIKDKVEGVRKSCAADQYRANQYKEFLSWNLPDLRTRQDISNLRRGAVGLPRGVLDAFAHFGMEAIVQDLIEIFETKKDVDDEIVNDAWDRVLVGEVMDA